jgi:hypothetical protein
MSMKKSNGTIGNRTRDLPVCSTVPQNETNVMHILFNFSFNLFKIKSLYMFRALLAHLQEALHKRYLVYCVRVMSVGCTLVQPTDITRK